MAKSSGRYRLEWNAGASAALVDAICAGERAATSLLGSPTSGTSGVRPEAVRWKDFRAAHNEQASVRYDNPGSDAPRIKRAAIRDKR